MIDIHNHYLAAVDDGPEVPEESLLLARLAVEQGISHVLCTPHYHHGRYDWQAEKVAAAFALLQQQVAEAGLPLTLAYAAEVRISDEILPDIRQGKVPFCGQWQGRDALLLEMPHAQIPVGIEALLKWLLKEGIQPIIAHPERNKAIMRDVRRAQELTRGGALLQLTAGSVAGHFGPAAQQAAEHLLAQRCVQFIASDAHNPKRPPAMREGAAAVEAFARKQFGDAAAAAKLAEQLSKSNPEQLTASLFR